jgi:hypothetical protein
MISLDHELWYTRDMSEAISFRLDDETADVAAPE